MSCKLCSRSLSNINIPKGLSNSNCKCKFCPKCIKQLGTKPCPICKAPRTKTQTQSMILNLDCSFSCKRKYGSVLCDRCRARNRREPSTVKSTRKNSRTLRTHKRVRNPRAKGSVNSCGPTSTTSGSFPPINSSPNSKFSSSLAPHKNINSGAVAVFAGHFFYRELFVESSVMEIWKVRWGDGIVSVGDVRIEVCVLFNIKST